MAARVSAQATGSTCCQSRAGLEGGLIVLRCLLDMRKDSRGLMIPEGQESMMIMASRQAGRHDTARAAESSHHNLHA